MLARILDQPFALQQVPAQLPCLDHAGLCGGDQFARPNARMEIPDRHVTLVMLPIEWHRYQEIAFLVLDADCLPLLLWHMHTLPATPARKVTGRREDDVRDTTHLWPAQQERRGAGDVTRN